MSRPALDLARLTVWFDGEFRPYAETGVGLLSHGLNYGTGCFEGIRGFWDGDELWLLQLEDHYDRLIASSRILLMKLGRSVGELCDLTVDLCARNGFRGDVYVRAVAFKNAEDIGVRLHGVGESLALVAIPFERYFEGSDGLRCGTSSWRRVEDVVAPARAKITGVYVNSALAKSEAQLNGFDEAIMLSADGHVSEGSAENLFVVRRGTLYTPDPSQNILEGVTRRAVITIARDELGLEVVERAIDRSELFSADELFVTGSAAGVQWIKEVDHRAIGEGRHGRISSAIAKAYDDAVRGRNPRYRGWLRPTYAGRVTAAAARG